MSVAVANAKASVAPPAPRVARAWPRPAPGLVWALIAWGVLGLAVSVGLVPARVWLLAIGVLAAVAVVVVARIHAGSGACAA